jgi:hypothetical protein
MTAPTRTVPDAATVSADAVRRAAAIPAMVPPLVVAGIAAAGCLLVGLVDPTRTQLFPPCPFKAITGGLDCPGCGATRAMHSMLNGDIAAAAGFNAMLLVALPYLLYSWLAWAMPAVTNRRLPILRIPAKAVYGILAVVMLWWVARNLPLAPFAALHSDR